MNAPTSDFGGKRPGCEPGSPSADASAPPGVRLPPPPDVSGGPGDGAFVSSVFDAAIGRDVARRVAERPGRSRRAGAQQEVLQESLPEKSPEVEPEEVNGKGSPHRRCIVTGDVLPHDQMIRFVLNPEGLITPDLAGTLPGRGYWVTARHETLSRAAHSPAFFSRAARRAVSLPPQLPETVAILAKRACLATLGLARRAWAVDYGYDAVRQALVNHKAGLVMVASNAPRDFVGKLEGVRGAVPLNTLFTTADLSGALGRDSLAFVAVAKGQWTVRLALECARLAQVLPPRVNE